MAKATKKKRNKPYRGQDAAAPDSPVIRRYEAVERNRIGQWWFEKKKIIKPLGIAGLIIIVIIWLLFELLRIVF